METAEGRVVCLCWAVPKFQGPTGLQDTAACTERFTPAGVLAGIQTPMAPGRSDEIDSMIKWIRKSVLSIKNSLSLFLSQTMYQLNYFSKVKSPTNSST